VYECGVSFRICSHARRSLDVGTVSSHARKYDMQLIKALCNCLARFEIVLAACVLVYEGGHMQRRADLLTSNFTLIAPNNPASYLLRPSFHDVMTTQIRPLPATKQ
jgi:hypothetical protein